MTGWSGPRRWHGGRGAGTRPQHPQQQQTGPAGGGVEEHARDTGETLPARRTAASRQQLWLLAHAGNTSRAGAPASPTAGATGAHLNSPPGTESVGRCSEGSACFNRRLKPPQTCSSSAQQEVCSAGGGASRRAGGPPPAAALAPLARWNLAQSTPRLSAAPTSRFRAAVSCSHAS